MWVNQAKTKSTELHQLWEILILRKSKSQSRKSLILSKKKILSKIHGISMDPQKNGSPDTYIHPDTFIL